MDYTGIVEHLDEQKYHAVEAASSTGLATILRKSAKHYRYGFDHPDEKDSASMRIGSAVHAHLLEPGTAEARFPQVPDGLTRKSKDGKAWFEAQEAQGRTPLSADEGLKVLGMVSSVLADPDASLLLSGPKRELSLFWEWDDPLASGCPCKARIDALHPSEYMVVDLKTTSDATPRHFTRAIADYGYLVQLGFYTDAVRRFFPDPKEPGRIPRFIWVCVENTPPHDVAIWEAQDEFGYGALDKGRALYRDALAQYDRCRRSGVWPGYPKGIRPLMLPKWIFTQGGEG